MPAPTKKRLYGPDGLADIRLDRSAADAGTWTPEDEGTPDDVVLDGREWETVRLVADFHDASDNIVSGGTVTVTPLVAIPNYQSGSSPGRRWLELPQISGATVTDFTEIASEGHLLSFRIDAIALGGADHLDIRVTGGKFVRPNSP